MWLSDKNFPARGFSTPPPTWKSKRSSPMMPASEKKWRSPPSEADLFHVIHKVPTGDSPYVRAKHVQLIDKDPSRAISLFWAAINSDDRVDSALKDMAVVMKQLNRSDEAIEAIKSFRHLCPPESQESLDNVLVELYKRSGRIEEQIEMLQSKLQHIEEGISFGGKRTKMGRSQGKKIQITMEQEYSRLLGNLAWAYLQQKDYKSAEEHYRKALSLEQDKNKQCNLAICLMHTNRMTEAKLLLQSIKASPETGPMEESYANSFERAIQMMCELESSLVVKPIEHTEESCKGIGAPLPSVNYRNSNELSISMDGLGFLRRLTDKDRVLLGERNRGFYVRDHHENKNNFSESSPQKLFRDQMKRGTHNESPYAGRFDFGNKRNENWAGIGGIGQRSCKRAYPSPIPEGGILKVPFTQPRRSSLSFDNGGRRRTLMGEDTIGGCSRKLSFEQPIISKKVQSFSNQNQQGQQPVFTNEMSTLILQDSESQLPSINGDWRKRSLTDHAAVVNESVSQSDTNVEWNQNSKESDGQKKLAKRDCLPVQSSVNVDCARPREACLSDGYDKDSIISITDSLRLSGTVEPIAESLESKQELQNQNQPVSGDLKGPQDFSLSKSKKSWADMVEEDEEELLSGGTESSFSFQTPGKWSDGCNREEEHNDENLNSNIISENLTPLNQIGDLFQKIESLDLGGGYYTQPENAASSMSKAVRRSLCFDQYQVPDIAENYCSSPFPNKALNFEGQISVLENETVCTSGNGIKLMRGNRLQVFRDITFLSESPRP